MSILALSEYIFFKKHLSVKDKQKNKIKEKLDKCVKEKLLEVCDLLDLPVTRAASRKVCLCLLLSFRTLYFLLIWQRFCYLDSGS